MRVPGKLTDCIKKRFGLIKILFYEISIAFMKFHCGYFIIAQVLNIGFFITLKRYIVVPVTKFKFGKMVTQHFRPGDIVISFNKYFSRTNRRAVVLIQGTYKRIILDIFIFERLIKLGPGRLILFKLFE